MHSDITSRETAQPAKPAPYDAVFARTRGIKVQRARSRWLALAVAANLTFTAAASADAEPSKHTPPRAMGDVVYQGPRCTFTKREAIAMVSWIFWPAGAVITGLACKRNLFAPDADRR